MSERIDWDALIPNFLDRDVVKVAARAVQLTGGTTRKGIVAGCKAQAEHLRAIAARNRQAATHNRNRASRDDDLAVAHGMEHRATKLEGIANAYA